MYIGQWHFSFFLQFGSGEVCLHFTFPFPYEVQVRGSFPSPSLYKKKNSVFLLIICILGSILPAGLMAANGCLPSPPTEKNYRKQANIPSVLINKQHAYLKTSISPLSLPDNHNLPQSALISTPSLQGTGETLNNSLTFFV